MTTEAATKRLHQDNLKRLDELIEQLPPLIHGLSVGSGVKAEELHSISVRIHNAVQQVGGQNPIYEKSLGTTRFTWPDITPSSQWLRQALGTLKALKIDLEAGYLTSMEAVSASSLL